MTDWTAPEDVPADTVDRLHRWLLQEGNPADAATPGERAVADIIRTFWPVPPRTLAEGLEYRADLLDNGDPDGDTASVLRTLATDAIQMEHDLTEAHAEVERLTTERDSAREEIAWLRNGPGHTEVATDLPNPAAAQKGAETTAETPDPADVKPGEAWLVEYDGEKRNGVKDSDAYIQWNTVTTNGVFHAENNEDVTLITRLVPAPRTITNAEDLDRAKRDTIIRDARGVVCSRDSAGTAWTTFINLTDQRRHITLPATVLWEPGA